MACDSAHRGRAGWDEILAHGIIPAWSTWVMQRIVGGSARPRFIHGRLINGTDAATGARPRSAPALTSPPALASLTRSPPRADRAPAADIAPAGEWSTREEQPTSRISYKRGRSPADGVEGFRRRARASGRTSSGADLPSDVKGPTSPVYRAPSAPGPETLLVTRAASPASGRAMTRARGLVGPSKIDSTRAAEVRETAKSSAYPIRVVCIASRVTHSAARHATDCNRASFAPRLREKACRRERELGQAWLRTAMRASFTLVRWSSASGRGTPIDGARTRGSSIALNHPSARQPSAADRSRTLAL